MLLMNKKKYIIINKFLKNRDAIIHDKWLIEEKAKNFRKEIWFIPKNLLIIEEKND